MVVMATPNRIGQSPYEKRRAYRLSPTPTCFMAWTNRLRGRLAMRCRLHLPAPWEELCCPRHPKGSASDSIVSLEESHLSELVAVRHPVARTAKLSKLSSLLPPIDATRLRLATDSRQICVPKNPCESLEWTPSSIRHDGARNTRE